MLTIASRSLTSAREHVMSTIDTRAEQAVRKALAEADVGVDGARPEDMLVHDKSLYTRMIRQGQLGFGEGYMDGQWDCEALDVLTAKLVWARLATEYRSTLSTAFHQIMSRAKNLQTQLRAFEVAERHYDIGNDLYQAMLDHSRRPWSMHTRSLPKPNTQMSAGSWWPS